MIEEPPYHCRACARDRSRGRMAIEATHRARRDAIEGLLIAAIAAVVVVALVAGVVVAVKAVFW